MDLQTNLFYLHSMLPSQYLSTERMLGKDELKKKAIVGVWQKIVVEGQGFIKDDCINIDTQLKTYLKSKCVSKQVGNFSTFCRKWCEEILPQLVIKDEAEIQRIYAIFNLLGKEFVEADTFGVHTLSKPLQEYESLVNRISEVKTFLEMMSFVSSVFNCVVRGITRLPWWISASAVTLSRYRTARQCLVGAKIVTETLKQKHSNYENLMNQKFNAFQNLQASTARMTSDNNVVERDVPRTIEDIRKISSERVGALFFKIAVAVSIFASSFYFFPDLVKFASFMGIPGMLYNENILHGALPAMCAMACSTYIQVLGLISIPFFLTLTYVSLAIAPISTLALFLLGTLSISSIIPSIMRILKYDEMLSVKAANRFFNDAPWHPNDFATSLGLPLSKAIDYLLDKFLSLIDGHAQAVKVD